MWASAPSYANNEGASSSGTGTHHQEIRGRFPTDRNLETNVPGIFADDDGTGNSQEVLQTPTHYDRYCTVTATIVN